MVKKLYINIFFIFIFCFKVCFSNCLMVNKVVYNQNQNKGYYYDVDKNDRLALIQIKNKFAPVISGFLIFYSKFTLRSNYDSIFLKMNNYIKLFLFDFRKKIFEVMRSKFFGTKYKDRVALL